MFWFLSLGGVFITAYENTSNFKSRYKLCAFFYMYWLLNSAKSSQPGQDGAVCEGTVSVFLTAICCCCQGAYLGHLEAVVYCTMGAKSVR